jgi:hypothetical protein
VICPFCKEHVALTPEGRFPAHRISDRYRHRWSFCEMSGESVEVAARAVVA